MYGCLMHGPFAKRGVFGVDMRLQCPVLHSRCVHSVRVFKRQINLPAMLSITKELALPQ